MSDDVEAGLLAAIRERPEDDAPRLVYADWLTERGDPRGELIAVQCALARLERDDDARPRLEERDRELRTAHEEAWRGELAQLPGFASGYLERGFVRRLAMDEGALGIHLAAALAAAPLLEEVYLSRERRDDDADEAEAPAELARLRGIRYHTTRYALAGLESGHLDGLAALELGRDVDVPAVVDGMVARPLRLRRLDARFDGCLGKVLAWPGAAALEDLDAARSAVDGSIAARLARLANLRTLRLGDNRLHDEGVRALVTSPHLRSLVELDLARTRGRAAIAEARLPALTRLRYGENDLRGGAANKLAAAPGLANLELLDLRGSNRPEAPLLDVDGAIAVVSSPNLARLHTLILEQHRFGDRTLATILAAAKPGLRRLVLPYSDLDEAAARALAHNPNLASVVELDLSSNPFGPGAAEALAASPYLRPRTLRLAYTRLGREGIAGLVHGPVLSECRVLELASCRLHDEDVEPIAMSSQLGNLMRLLLGHNERIGDDAASRLARSGRLPRLAEVAMQRTEVGNAGRRALARSGRHLVV
ncbi:MAG: TIGR02996 domain-containing protein [Deltaproteobacteria bacterium]|nr:TIGR02996 domain-containing protein [Deltaproteobacteria bacterium]